VPGGADRDLELLDAWCAGDEDAGNQLVKRHFRAVYGFFRNKIDGDVDDLIQRTFLGCVESRGKFRRESTFRTYLFAIARNELYMALRRRLRGQALNFTEASIDDCHVADATPTAEIAQRQERRLLLRALRRIPVDDQVALELYYWQGLSAREVGEILELPENSVRSRLHRAKAKLRERVAELTADGDLLNSTMDDFDRWASEMKLQRA